jgi:pimeloyl-ACP methyl ester carboxylesterase
LTNKDNWWLGNHQSLKGAATTMNADTTPTIVFVHGAWADASGFGESIRAVRDRGFATIGFANPLRHLTGDAAELAALLGTISGPIVLVGHSYGGAVMSNAAAGNEQVQALVFVAGWMPDEGESIQQLLESEAFADSLVAAALRPLPFTNPDDSEGLDLYLDRELFPEAFCADVDSDTAAVMAATQRPWSGAAAATPSGPAGWRSIPSWYLLGTEDRAIPPAGQRFMAERGNARIEEVVASHASMVSQPEAVTRLILSVVEETSRSRP